MYIIAFENEADYKKYSDMVEKDLTHGATFSTGDPWEIVARHEARYAVENKLIDQPELYYDEDFDDNIIVDGIVETLSESDLIDEFYQEASHEFDNQVNRILEERHSEL